MLRISSGIYFDTDVLYETDHRRAASTDDLRSRAEDKDRSPFHGAGQVVTSPHACAYFGDRSTSLL